MSEVVKKFEGLTATHSAAPRKKELTDDEKRYNEIAKGYEAAIQAIFVKLDTTSVGSLVSLSAGVGPRSVRCDGAVCRRWQSSRGLCRNTMEARWTRNS